MLARRHWVLGIAGLAFATLGCSDDGDDDHHEGTNTDLTGVVYVGRVTDEALEHLLDRPPEDVESERLVIDSPESGATLSKDEPAIIAYHSALTTGRLEHRRVRERKYVTPSFRQRAVKDLLDLFGPIKEAHAHGTPFNGTAYFLTISDAGGADALRVFTDATSHQPTADEWTALADAPQPLALTIVSALFEENDVLVDGGPFLGGTAEFSVE